MTDSIADNVLKIATLATRDINALPAEPAGNSRIN